MSEKTSKAESFVWGLVPLIIGIISPIPLTGLLTLILLWFFYLKKRKVSLTYYLVGYFILVIIASAILGSLLIGGAIL